MVLDQLRRRIWLVDRPGMLKPQPSTATVRDIVNPVHIYFVVKEKPLSKCLIETPSVRVGRD